MERKRDLSAPSVRKGRHAELVRPRKGEGGAPQRDSIQGQKGKWKHTEMERWREKKAVPTPTFDLGLFLISHSLEVLLGFLYGSGSKESAYSVGDLGLIPGSGRSPGGGHGNPLQYSCLQNPMDRGDWRATVHGFPKSWT